MALPTLNDDLAVISKLDDLPNDVGGLTAADLKAKFDEAAGAIQTYINDTLLPYLESVSGAGGIGITTVSGIQAATNVQEALEALELNIEGVSQGAVANNSITNAKMAANAIDTANIVDDAVTSGKIADGAIRATHFSAGAVGNTAMGASAVNTTNIAGGAVTTAKLADTAVTSVKIADGAVTQNKLSTSAIVASNIANNAVETAKIKDANITTAKLADSAVTSIKIADSAVTSTKINDGAITENKLADDLKSLVFENVSVAASAWVSDATYADFGYKAVLACTDVTSDYFVDVVLPPNVAMSGSVAPIASPGSDTVTIYSSDNTLAFTIPTIFATK